MGKAKLALRILAVPLASGGPSTSTEHAVHHLYLKRHATRRAPRAEGFAADGDEAAAAKPLPTLFVANLPPVDAVDDEAMERFLRAHFEATAGRVRGVECHQLQSVSMRCAHVVFDDAEAIAAALRSPFASATETWSSAAGEVEGAAGGLAAQLAAYAAARAPAVTLRKRVNARISDFEAKEEAVEREKKRRREVMDADGFTLVSRKHQVTKATMQRNERERGGKKKGELKNFYAFQMREEKKSRLTLLRSRFEEDKKRIAAMQAARKFRPDR
jgi:ribosomal RNA-processing protein 7